MSCILDRFPSQNRKWTLTISQIPGETARSGQPTLFCFRSSFLDACCADISMLAVDEGKANGSVWVIFIDQLRVRALVYNQFSFLAHNGLFVNKGLDMDSRKPDPRTALPHWHTSYTGAECGFLLAQGGICAGSVSRAFVQYWGRLVPSVARVSLSAR